MVGNQLGSRQVRGWEATAGGKMKSLIHTFVNRKMKEKAFISVFSQVYTLQDCLYIHTHTLIHSINGGWSVCKAAVMIQDILLDQ